MNCQIFSTGLSSGDFGGTIPETASRLRGRIEAIIDAAQAAGHIPKNESNPARWKGHLDKLLPKPAKLIRGHHQALPYQKVPEFIQRLHNKPNMAAVTLEFLILTATRTSEVLGATWSEIDLSTGIWTIPAARMKAKREHRVPLSSQALTILTRLHETRLNNFVFPGQRSGHQGVTILVSLRRRMNLDFTIHGFRSSFRDWCGEETEHPREIAEAALAHQITGTEAAYRRGDALDKRRALMQSWGNYLLPRPPDLT